MGFDDIEIISYGNISMSYAQNTTMGSTYLNTQSYKDKEEHKPKLIW